MFGTYSRLNVRTWASDIAVIRAARKKLHKRARTGRHYRAARHGFYRDMLKYHHNAQELCRAYRM